jgi:hypothetical protein
LKRPAVSLAILFVPCLSSARLNAIFNCTSDGGDARAGLRPSIARPDFFARVTRVTGRPASFGL